jgi:CRP/FNR family transcriptional regulator, cyclic AMP receptor protein
MSIHLQAQRIDLLQGMPVFGGIRADALELLLAQARLVEVAAQAYFFREGDQAQAMYVLERGRAAVLKAWEGRDYLLHYLGAGDCLGEMALMDLFPRSASVRAVLDCSAIEITPGDMLRLAQADMEQFALIQMNIGREVCRRLRATDELLFASQHGSAELGRDTVFRHH